MRQGQFVHVRVLAADADHTEEGQCLRVALPIAQQLDIGGAGEVGELEALEVFLILLCHDLLDLELAFVWGTTRSALCFQLLKLVVVACEEGVCDKSMNGC